MVVVAYRARRRLEYPTGAGVIARIQRGEAVPYKDRGMVVAEEGDVVGNLPKPSIPWLLRKGWIEEVREDG
jgi:hypothetical protein